MYLKYADIDYLNGVEYDCYITHPKRCDDTDDMVLDAANQLQLSKKYFITWLTSEASWECMEDEDDCDNIDFYAKLSQR